MSYDPLLTVLGLVALATPTNPVIFDGLDINPQALPMSPLAGRIAVDSSDGNKLKWWDGSAWQAAGGGGTPAGSNTEIQYNNLGSFGADPNFYYDGFTVYAQGVSSGSISLGGSVPIVLNANPTADIHLGGAGQLRVMDSGLTNILFAVDNSGYLTLGGVTYLFPNADGVTGDVLSTDGSGNLSWTTVGGGTPAGSDTQIQFNNAGAFGANSAFTYTPGSLLLSNIATATSGNATWTGAFLKATWASSGSTTTPIYGVTVRASTTGTGTNADYVVGISNEAANDNTAGTLTALFGSYTDVRAQGVGGATTLLYGMYCQVHANASHTVTSAYGIFIDTSTIAANPGTRFGIYQNDSNASCRNYFASSTGIRATASTSAALTLAAATTSLASLRLPHGTAPTTPVNGDIWTTTLGLYAQINGSTVGPFSAGGGTPAGANTQIQFNNSGSFGADDDLTWTGAGGLVVGTAGGGQGITVISGSASGGLAVGTALALNQYINLRQPNITSGSPSAMWLVGGAHTTLLASTEAIDVDWRLNRTVQFSTGALTTQRAMYLRAPTYAFVGASTLTTAATLAISGPPAAGTNATITTPIALDIESGVLRTAASTTTVAGLRIPHGTAPTTPVNGDVWTTTSTLLVRINGTSRSFAHGTGSASRVALWNGTNDLTSNGSFTYTLTSGAQLLSHAAGTSTAVTGTNAFASSITYSATNNSTFGSIIGQTTITGAPSSPGVVYGVQGQLSLNPSGALSAGFYAGLYGLVDNTSGTTNRLTTTILGVYARPNISNANTTGTLASYVAGVYSAPRVENSASSGTSTLSNLFGVWIEPAVVVAAGHNMTVSFYVGLYVNALNVSGAGTLTLTSGNRFGIFQAGADEQNYFAGDVKVQTAGKGFFVKEGSNAKMGVATLVAGTVTVNTTAVGANSRIFLQAQNGVSGPHALHISARSAGVSFTITSSSAGDTSQIAWIIIDPA